MRRRPRLLFVSPRFLFPMDEGGKIRSGNILKGLKASGEFDVMLASPAPADIARHEAALAQACDRFVYWRAQPASKLRRAAALAGPLPVAVAADRSAAGQRAVAAALAEAPDVVVVDFPHADVLTPTRIAAPSVLFTHNVEAEIFERHADRAQGARRRLWADQAAKMRRFEEETLRRYDSVIAVSARDQRALIERYGAPVVETIDTGVDLDFFAPTAAEREPDIAADGGVLVFTASMNWPANVDGVNFLLDEVWPRLIAARPNLRAVLIGRDPPPALAEKIRRRGLNVTLTGYVDDVRPYVAEANVYVIPLLVGSGTRIKAFEAMAMGRPLVSTTVGVEGLKLSDGWHYLRADGACDFAAAVLRLLDEPALRRRLADAARGLVEERYAWSAVARQFEQICLRAIARRRAVRPRSTVDACAALAAGPAPRLYG